MSAFVILLSEAWVVRLGWVLVHFLWQGAVIGIFAGIVLTLFRKYSAKIRYALLCATLMVCGLSPCLTWAILSKETQTPVESAIVSDSSSVKPPLAAALDKTSLAGIPASISAGQHTSSPIWSLEYLSRIIQAALPYFVTLWSLGVIILGLRLVYSWTQLRRFCASGQPLKDQAWIGRLNVLANRMGIHRTVLLLESAFVEVPMVIGWFRPVILAPVIFFTGLPPDQIEAILAHELAHIRRHDYLVNLIQIAIETLLFYHPTVWWISRAMREERENCCDDFALQIVGNKATYASALAALEESRSLPMEITLAATGGSLLKRVQRLAGVGAPNPANRRWVLLGASLLVILFILSARAFLLPMGKAEAAPKLHFVVGGKAIDLSPHAQTKIISEIEAAVLAINSDSKREPEKFKSTFYSFTPKLIEEDGLYFRVVYPQTKTFAAINGPIQAKEIYLTSSPNGNLLGYPPGGILLVSDDGRLTHVTLASDTPLLNLTFNADVYSQLPDQLKWQVGRALPGYLSMSNSEGFEPELRLVAAANEGDLPELKKLLAQGVKLDQIPAGVTTLLFAAGSPEVAKFLLDQGTKVDARNKEGDTALISICYNDSGRRKQELVAATARVLLKHGADPNAHNYADWTPLIVARDGAAVDALVEYGADVHAKINGHGILDELDLGWRELSYYQALAAHGLAIDNHENGLHLLMHAVSQGGYEDIVIWLLDRGVDPNQTDPATGKKPLTLAAESAAQNAAKILIAHGAKIGDADMNSAIDSDRDNVIKVFWENGAKKISELFYDVSQNAPVEKMQALLDKGMPADPPQDKRVTPLALAARHGNLAAVQLLVEHGANPNKKTSDRTPLSAAAWMGHEDIVQYLLQHGARPNADTVKDAIAGCYMWTQFYQRRPGNPTVETFYKIIQHLIDAGAYKNLQPDQVAGALVLTKPEGMGDWYDLGVIKILLAAGLDPTAKNAEGRNAIDLVQARYDKIKDAQTRAHLLELLNLFKAEPETKKPEVGGRDRHL